MRIPRCFYPESISNNTTVTLDSKLGHYLRKVLRLNNGHTIKLFNNTGYEFTGTLMLIDKHTTQLEITDAKQIDNESPLKIHLFQGISRGERMEHSLQKSVELGVSEITPVMTKRSEVKLNPDKIDKKMNHWNGIIISASEQSGRTYAPSLNNPVYIHEINCNQFDACFILEPSTETSPLLPKSITSAALFVGPEGGFESFELEQLKHNNCFQVSIGSRVLRTETATLAGILLLQQRWGDIALD